MSQTEPRIQAPQELPGEDLDLSLRPRRLVDFVGQEPVKDQLAVSLAAAASRGEALDHVLLAGPPGLGKTSLAQIVAAELEVPFVQTAGPALERKGDVAPGYDADLWLVDLNHEDVVRKEDLLYRNPFSAHEGQPIRGRTVRAVFDAVE